MTVGIIRICLFEVYCTDEWKYRYCNALFKAAGYKREVSYAATRWGNVPVVAEGAQAFALVGAHAQSERRAADVVGLERAPPLSLLVRAQFVRDDVRVEAAARHELRVEARRVHAVDGERREPHTERDVLVGVALQVRRGARHERDERRAQQVAAAVCVGQVAVGEEPGALTPGAGALDGSVASEEAHVERSLRLVRGGALELVPGRVVRDPEAEVLELEEQCLEPHERVVVALEQVLELEASLYERDEWGDQFLSEVAIAVDKMIEQKHVGIDVLLGLKLLTRAIVKSECANYKVPRHNSIVDAHLIRKSSIQRVCLSARKPSLSNCPTGVWITRCAQDKDVNFRTRSAREGPWIVEVEKI